MRRKHSRCFHLLIFFDVIRPQWLPDYPRETFSAQVGSINLKLMRTKHIPDSSQDWQSSFWSCGIIIDNRVFFTSDTRYDPELIEYYDNMYHFETIFHDCQFFTGGVHASLEEITRFSPEIKKRIYLTHYGDNWEDFEGTIAENNFGGLTQQHIYYTF